MSYELNDGICSACVNSYYFDNQNHKIEEKLTKKEYEKTRDDWFDSLFTEPKCDNATQ